MTIGEVMQKIAEEAERQGFFVRQTKSGMWHFRHGTNNWFFAPEKLEHVLLDVLRVLIAAGLDWTDTD